MGWSGEVACYVVFALSKFQATYDGVAMVEGPNNGGVFCTNFMILGVVMDRKYNRRYK